VGVERAVLRATPAVLPADGCGRRRAGPFAGATAGIVGLAARSTEEVQELDLRAFFIILPAATGATGAGHCGFPSIPVPDAERLKPEPTPPGVSWTEARISAQGRNHQS